MLLPLVKEQITENGKQMIISNKKGQLVINNPTFNDVFGLEIKRVLDLEKNTKSGNFDNYKIYIFGEDFFLLETDNMKKRDDYKNFLDENFKKINNLLSKKLEKNRQIPENSGYFEYNGKYYIVIEAYNRLTDEIDEKKGIYKGVLVKPELFVKSEDIEEEVEKNKGKVRDKLINNKKLYYKIS